MGTWPPIAARHRAPISILLSLLSLIFTLPVLFFLPWFWWPVTSGGSWPRDLMLSTGAYILFIAMNLASVMTAFYNHPRPVSWPGKIAMALALPVAVLVLPLSILMFITFIQTYFLNGH
jgi:hypothetical protein